jgi:hypothetical protein
MTGRARGEEQRRDIVLVAGLDLGRKPRRPLAVGGTSLQDQLIQRGQARLVVVAQAARVVEPDAPELRALPAQLQHLVDLLLVLHDGEGNLGVVQRKDELRRDGVLIKRHRHGAERLRGQHGGVKPRAVLADDDHMRPAPQARGRQAECQLPHQHGKRRPGQRLPHAEGFLAQRRRVGPAGRVVEQEPWKGGQACLRCAGWSPRL